MRFIFKRKKDSESQFAHQMDMMKWNVERMEVANLTIITRATNSIGYSIVELGLLANVVVSHPVKNSGVKIALVIGILFASLALVFFISTLSSRFNGAPYENEDFSGKSTRILVKMLYRSTINGKFPEEHLQRKENEQRAWRLNAGLGLLALSAVPIVTALAISLFP